MFSNATHPNAPKARRELVAIIRAIRQREPLPQGDLPMNCCRWRAARGDEIGGFDGSPVKETALRRSGPRDQPKRPPLSSVMGRLEERLPYPPPTQRAFRVGPLSRKARFYWLMAVDRAFTPQSRRLGASGTFFQWVRLSAMILVDCSAAWLKVAYSTISRCTRAASLCSVSRNVCNSVMSLSISCTDVPVTRCKSWLMLLATSSLSLSG